LIKDAALAAGLSILRLVDESIAAVIGHDMDKIDGERDLLVFNLNSQNFDVAVNYIDRGVIEIVAHASGDIGSDDLEEAMFDLFLGDMRAQVLDAEKVLATKKSATIQQKVTQAELQNAYKKVFHKIVPLIDQVIKEAKLPEGQVLDGIILTGNVEQIAKLQPFIEAHLGTKVYNVVRSDETIIRGLTQQSGVLSGQEGTDVYTLSMDVNPLSIGVDVGGIFRKVISRNTVIPTRKRVTVTTVFDDQEWIIVDIIEGERLISSKNQVLGALEIPIPPTQAGVPRVEVAFELDANGILKVSAELKNKQELCLNEAIWEGAESVECMGDIAGGGDTNGLSGPAAECKKIEKCGKVELLVKDTALKYSYAEYDQMVMEAEGSLLIDTEEKDAIERDLQPGKQAFQVIEEVRDPWVQPQSSWMSLPRRIGQWLGWWGYDMPNDVNFHWEF
jgi:molecular chaperone DnaK (HSP70)